MANLEQEEGFPPLVLPFGNWIFAVTDQLAGLTMVRASARLISG